MTDPTPRPSVLIIDDNIDAADSLARFLHVGAGLEVRVAYDARPGSRRPSNNHLMRSCAILACRSLTECSSPES